jgi:hypothetical protein
MFVLGVKSTDADVVYIETEYQSVYSLALIKFDVGFTHAR